MPKRSRLQRPNIRQQIGSVTDELPEVNQVEDLQRAIGGLFQQLTRYTSQTQNVVNITRGFDKQVTEILNVDSGYKQLVASTNLYITSVGRVIRSYQSFSRETGRLLSGINGTYQALTQSSTAVRNFANSFSVLKGSEGFLQALQKILQRIVQVLNSIAKEATRTALSWEKLVEAGRTLRVGLEATQRAIDQTNGALATMQRILRRFSTSEFYIQFQRTFRTGNIEIDIVNNNIKRMAALLGLLLRPLGIVVVEYERLTRGRHREFLDHLQRIYVATTKVAGAFIGLTGSSSNLLANLLNLGKAFNQFRKSPDIFNALNLVFRTMTFSVHLIIDAILSFRRNIALTVIAVRDLIEEIRQFYTYLRSAQARSDFPTLTTIVTDLNRRFQNLIATTRVLARDFQTLTFSEVQRNSLILVQVHLRAIVDILTELDTRTLRLTNLYRIFERLAHAARRLRSNLGSDPDAQRFLLRLQDHFVRLNRQVREFDQAILRIGRNLANLAPRFNQPTIIDPRTIQAQEQFVPQASRRTFVAPQQFQQRILSDEDARNISNQDFATFRDQYLRELRNSFREFSGAQLSLSVPLASQLGNVGTLNEARRRQNLIDRLNTYQSAIDSGQTLLSRRSYGPVPAPIFDNRSYQQQILDSIIDFAAGQFADVMQDERVRKELRDSVVEQERRRRDTLNEEERRISRLREEFTGTGGDAVEFENLLRDQRSRRRLPGDDAESEEERIRRLRRDFDATDYDPNRLGSLFGFLRFGEDVEPLADQAFRGMKRLFNRITSNVRDLGDTFPTGRTRGLFARSQLDDAARRGGRAFENIGESTRRAAQNTREYDGLLDGVINNINNYSGRLRQLNDENERANAVTSRVTGTTKGLSTVFKGLLFNILPLVYVLRSVLIYSIGGAIAAFLGFTGYIARFVSRLDELRLKLGLSINTLRAWQFVAADVGLTTNNVIQVFQKLDSQIVNLLKAQDAQIALFSKLGLSIENLQGLNVGDIFVEVLGNLQGISSQTERLALATQLFGNSAFRVLQLNAQGIESLRRQLAKYQDRPLGSNEELRRLRQLNSEFIKLKLNAQALAITLASSASRGFLRAIEYVNNFSVNIEKLANTRIDGFINAVTFLLKILSVSVLIKIIQAFGGLRRIFLTLGNAVGVGTRDLKNFFSLLVGTQRVQRTQNALVFTLVRLLRNRLILSQSIIALVPIAIRSFGRFIQLSAQADSLLVGFFATTLEWYDYFEANVRKAINLLQNELVPALGRLANEIYDFFVTTIPSAIEVALSQGFIVTFEQIEAYITDLFRSIRDRFGSLRDQAREASAGLDSRLADEEQNRARIEQEQIALARLRQQGQIQLGVDQRGLQQFNALNNLLEQSHQNIRRLRDEINLTPEELGSASYRLLTERMQVLRQNLRQAREEAEALKAELFTRIKFGLEIDPNLTRRLEQILRFIRNNTGANILDNNLRQQFAQQSAQEDALIRARDRVNDFRQAIDNSGQAVGNFLSQTTRLFDSFSDHIKQAVRDLAQTILNELQNALVVQPIVQFLTQFAQAGATALAARFGATPVEVPDFARHGGIHQGLTVLGEAGPELVNFRSPARVYPNRDLGSLLGGFTQNNTFNVSGSDAETVTNAIIAAAPILTEAAKQGMIEDINRPSNVRRALRG